MLAKDTNYQYKSFVRDIISKNNSIRLMCQKVFQSCREFRTNCKPVGYIKEFP